MHTHQMLARAQTVSQHILTKLSLESKYIYTCVHQTNPIPANSQNDSHDVLAKPS